MKNQPYNNFWQKIHKAAERKGFPLRVMFEITYRCNFRCKHCYVPQSYRKKKGLTTEEVFSILDQLKDIGCFYLGFTGGEPFMRKDIMDILWYAKRCGLEIIIYTNGSLIDEKIADQLAFLRPNKVDITIPAISKDAFESITGIAGSRDKVFRTIELLHKRKVALGFKSCLLKENESEINQIQDFAALLNALHRVDNALSPRLDGSKEPYKYKGQTTEYRGQKIRSVIDCHLSDVGYRRKPKTEDRQPKTENLFKCGAGLSQVAITPQGELKMCLMIDYPKYKILSISLKGAWKRLKELVASINPDENYNCDTCELEPYCKWCPAMAWLNYRNFTSCDPESRRQAEMRRQLLNSQTMEVAPNR